MRKQSLRLARNETDDRGTSHPSGKETPSKITVIENPAFTQETTQYGVEETPDSKHNAASQSTDGCKNSKVVNIVPIDSSSCSYGGQMPDQPRFEITGGSFDTQKESRFFTSVRITEAKSNFYRENEKSNIDALKSQGEESGKRAKVSSQVVPATARKGINEEIRNTRTKRSGSKQNHGRNQ